MLRFFRLLGVVGFSMLALGASVKSNLIGTWIWEEGDAFSRTVQSLEFRGDGTFRRATSRPGLPPAAQKTRHELVEGKWSLLTDVTGIKALVADPNKLVLDYEALETEKAATTALPTLVRKTDVYVVVISRDQTFGNKVTLRLLPLDGALRGTQYFFRAE